MRYNKYALALALLASSAFASATFEPLADEIIAHMKINGSSFDLFTSAAGAGLTKEQKDKLNSLTIDYNDAGAAKTQIADALNEVEEARIKKLAQDIITKAGGDGFLISNTAFTDYTGDSSLTDAQYKAIAVNEYKTGTALTEALLIDFLKDATNQTLPAVDDSAVAVAARLIKLAKLGKVSEITDEVHRRMDLDDDNKFVIVKAFETGLGGPIGESQLEAYLKDGNFHALDKTVRTTVIETLSSSKTKVGDVKDLNVFATDKEIAAINALESKAPPTKATKAVLDTIIGANDTDLDAIISPSDPMDTKIDSILAINTSDASAKVSDASTLGALKTLVNDEARVDAIIYQEGAEKTNAKITKELLKDILTADANGLKALSKPAVSAEEAALNAKIASIMALSTDENVKITSTDEKIAELKAIVEDDAKVAAIKYQEVANFDNKRISEEVLRKIIEATSPEGYKDYAEPKAAPIPEPTNEVVKKAKAILALPEGSKRLADLKGKHADLISDKLMEAIEAEEKTLNARLDEAKLDEIINKVTEAEKKAAEEQEKAEKKIALIAKIKAALGSVDKFTDLAPEAIAELKKGTDLTDAQIAALASLTKTSADTDIEAALNAKAKPEQEKAAEELIAAKDKMTATIAKIKEALKDVGKFSDLTKETLEKLKNEVSLNDAQIAALANLTKASADADFEAALNAKAKSENEKTAEEAAKMTANIAKIKEALKAVGKFSDLTKETLEKLKKEVRLNDAQIAALANLTKASTDAEFGEALNAKAKPENEKAAEEAAAKEKRKALIAKIKTALATVGKFSDLAPGAIAALKEGTDLTDAQITALANLTKASTDAEFEAALNGTGKASALNDAELKKIVEAIVKALGDKKFNELTEQGIKGLNLSPEHLAALQTANPDKDSDIFTILKGAKPVKTSDVNSNAGGSTTTEEKDTPFYKTYWFMALSVLILIAAIGGGAYMMSHKSEQTDL